jgi:acetyl esterase/lipase
VVTRAGKRLAGAAFERFGESVHDIRAAIALAVKSGYRRVILAGHSTGANKVLHYLARTRDRRVVGLILLGPVSDVAGERKRIGSPRACPEGLGHEVRRRSELCADVRAAESHRTRPPRPAGWRGSLRDTPELPLRHAVADES